MSSPSNFPVAHFEPRVGRSVSLGQAAEMLQVSIRTVYYWIREGRLRTIRTLNGSQRVLVDSLIAAGGHWAPSSSLPASSRPIELRRTV